jgi:hypothetical protein
MKKVSLVLAVLLLSLAVVSPALAYSGVTGTCIDNVTLAGWQHGGNVEVVGLLSNEVYGTGLLAPDGTFSIPLTTPNPDPGDVFLVITINYNIGPNGQPPQGQVIRTNVAGTATLDLGAIWVGTGPNAITLTDVSASGPSPWLPVGLAAAALVFAGIALVIHRKR